MDTSIIYKCTECGKSFLQKRYLQAHFNRAHKAFTEENEENNVFPCAYCEKTFNSKNTLSKHRIRIHEQYHSSLNMYCMEEGCTEKFPNLQLLRSHLKETHNYENQDVSEEKIFNLKDDFENWLSEEEKNAKCNFILARGEKKFNMYKRKEFVCSRSGNFTSNSEGKRQLKAQGSKRVGHHCTAQIILKDYEDHLSVQYFPKHYKHDFQLSHLPLPQETKNIVVGKLLHGVHDTRIVRDVRSGADEESERNILFTRKDLTNIKRNINFSDMHASSCSFDELSVQLWVKNMKEAGSHIFEYKEQNTPHPYFEDKDFFLAFMMPIQLDMLVKFGGDRVCIDSTHGLTAYEFELVTVMVIDEYEEGFPVAFCMTSSVTFKSMAYFFEKIKNVIPSVLKTKIFMSDDAQLFYQAWEKIFGKVEVHLLCAWHVDRAWQGHLNSVPMDKRKDVYKTLKSLTYELDEVTFVNALSEFLKQLENDPDTKTFHTYFMKYYANRTNMWAYCYRKGAKLNTNMHLEHFHREIKHIYLEGKKNKRVDKCCESLKNYIEDKKFERLVKLYKGKITKKHTASYQRHRESENIISACLQISEDKWSIPSTTFPSKSYTITKVHTCSETCNIICRECMCCISAYECTCHDFLISNNICKHIHAVNKKYTKQEVFYGPLQSTPTTEFPMHTNTTNQTRSSVPNKESILSKINNIYSKVQSKTSIDQVVANQILNSLNTVANLLDIDKPQNITSNPTSEPVNKKVVPQKRFFSTKKQKTKKQKLNKPSRDEQLNSLLALTHQPCISIDSSNEHKY